MNYLQNYRKNIPLYQEFINEIIYTIQEECKTINLKYADLKGRVKTIESVEEKIERNHYENPEKEIQDYAGVRIVCLFEKEKNRFGELIEKIFEVLSKENKKEKLDSNLMGYQSIHYLIKFGKNYKGPRYKKLNSLICEIQITTVLLEAWALINHTLVYKHENAIPVEIQRDINNVASLLEVAQKVFEDSNNKRNLYLQKIEKTSSDKNSLFAQPINFDTLSLFSKTIFPQMNTSDYIQNLLIEDINKNKYKTLGNIYDAIKEAEPFVLVYRKERPDLFQYSTDILTKSLGLVDLEFRKKHHFGKNTLIAFEKFEKDNYAR